MNHDHVLSVLEGVSRFVPIYELVVPLVEFYERVLLPVERLLEDPIAVEGVPRHELLCVGQFVQLLLYLLCYPRKLPPLVIVS